MIDIAPPIYFCNGIPDGCFDNSSLVYKRNLGEPNWQLVQRIPSDVKRSRKEIIPAPTMEEILSELRDMGVAFEVRGYDVITTRGELVRHGFRCRCKLNGKEYVAESGSYGSFANNLLKVWRAIKNDHFQN